MIYLVDLSVQVQCSFYKVSPLMGKVPGTQHLPHSCCTDCAYERKGSCESLHSKSKYLASPYFYINISVVTLCLCPNGYTNTTARPFLVHTNTNTSTTIYFFHSIDISSLCPSAYPTGTISRAALIIRSTKVVATIPQTITDPK